MPVDFNDSSEIIQKFQRDFHEHEHLFADKEKEIFAAFIENEKLKMYEYRTKGIHSVGRPIFRPEAIIVLKKLYYIMHNDTNNLKGLKQSLIKINRTRNLRQKDKLSINLKSNFFIIECISQI